MYDIKKLVCGNHVTVEEVIEQLKKLPGDAVFTCCGDERMFIHVEEDGSVVTIDTEILCEDGAYPEEVLCQFPDDDNVPKFGGSLHTDMVQVRYCPNKDQEYRANMAGYNLINGCLYWITHEDLLMTRSDIDVEMDVFSCVFPKNHCVGKIPRSALKTTGNRYYYKNIYSEDENKEEK